MLAVRARTTAAIHTCPQQHHSLTDAFLKDALTDRLNDDVPEVVSAALKVVEVSEEKVDRFPYRLVAVLFTLCIYVISVAV